MTIDDISTPQGFTTTEKEIPIIKVIGVGGGGCNAVSHMYAQNVRNVSFVVCNTDRQSLLKSPVPDKVVLGTLGHGAGNKPEKGRELAEESIEDIDALFDDATRMVFITAGMGGGTGTGAAPVVAREARERGLLTVGIVTIPFIFEGQKKILKALKGAEEMGKYTDALLVINNERLTEIYPDLHFENAFSKADDTLTIAAQGISELITDDNATINIDFEDVDTTLRNGGSAIISIGYGEGENRVTKAIQDALNSPLLKDRDVIGSKRILFNIYYNPDAENPFLMQEANELTSFITSIDHEVDVIWGLAPDKSLGDKVKITLLAAGFSIGTKDIARDSKKATEPLFPTPTVVGGQSVSIDARDKIHEVYGEGKVEDITKSNEAKKYIILTPDQINDDSIIEEFEKTPTSKRQVRVAAELRKASEHAFIAPEEPNPLDDAPGGTKINFI
ncbi:MAG: cell division protein FtsZ [Muribaculaceae bacterium]|nr:cell division protein FtsZ [Muribaculaceae bacterium]